MLPSDIRRTQRISPRWLRALAFRGSSLLVLAAFSVPASAADAPLMSEDARPPTVLEYEIVKGDQSYEVMIDFDADTKKATEVDVETNIWEAERTEKAKGDE